MHTVSWKYKLHVFDPDCKLAFVIRNAFGNSQNSRFKTSMMPSKGILRLVSVYKLTFRKNIDPVCLLQFFEYFARPSVRSMVFINGKIFIIRYFFRGKLASNSSSAHLAGRLLMYPFFTFLCGLNYNQTNYLLEV